MDYELSKKLKDSGFPKDYTEWNDHDEELLKKTWKTYGTGYSPTTDELLKALGKYFWRLTKNGEKYRAVSPVSVVTKQTTSSPHCDTVLEALAILWLRINKDW